MPKFRKKPVIVKAIQWFKNGDHPQDDCHYIYAGQVEVRLPWRADHGISLSGSEEVFDDKPSGRFLSEGKAVRYFRQPGISGSEACARCGQIMHVHGWIDTPEGGCTVCPGDWIIVRIEDKKCLAENDIFELIYVPTEEISTEPGNRTFITLPTG